MKKRSISLIIASFLIFSNLGVAVQAADDTSSKETAKSAAGITPDSILYKLDRIFDNINIALSVSNVGKAQTLIKVAEERLAESQLMADKSKYELAKTTLDDYVKKLDAAGEKLQTAAKEEKATDSESKKSKLDKVLDQLSKQYDTSSEKIEEIATKLKSSDSYASVEEMQIAKKSAVATMVDARHELNTARQAYNKAKGTVGEADAKTAYEKAQENLTAAVDEKQEAVHKTLVKQKDSSSQTASEASDKVKKDEKEKASTDNSANSQDSSKQKETGKTVNGNKTNNGVGNGNSKK